MKPYIVSLLLFFVYGCYSPRLTFKNTGAQPTGGEDFYKSIIAANLQEREHAAKAEILSGNMPSFLKKFKTIHFDTIMNGVKYRMKLFVLPDYLSIGTDKNFARIPLTPISAQGIADSLHCFLPTRKITNLIYKNARVKLEPIPMYALRDSAVTMFQHHLIIEGQRKLKKGIIAGIKKDVILTESLKSKPGKVAIYGWHRLNGKPIQPVYTGHVDWYVDYSHGIRLIYDTIVINGKKYHYTDVLTDNILHYLISDEGKMDFFRYPKTDFD